MAEQLEEFPVRAKKSKYGKWMDGQVWRINWREEMDNTNVENARSSLYATAASMGMRLRTQADGDDHVIVQSYKAQEDKGL